MGTACVHVPWWGPVPCLADGAGPQRGPPGLSAVRGCGLRGLEGTLWSWCRKGEEDRRPGGCCCLGSRSEAWSLAPSPDVCLLQDTTRCPAPGSLSEERCGGAAERSQRGSRLASPTPPQVPGGQGVSSMEASPVAGDAGSRARTSPGRGRKVGEIVRKVQGHPVSRCPRCWASVARTAWR